MGLGFKLPSGGDLDPANQREGFYVKYQKFVFVFIYLLKMLGRVRVGVGIREELEDLKKSEIKKYKQSFDKI